MTQHWAVLDRTAATVGTRITAGPPPVDIDAGCTAHATDRRGYPNMEAFVPGQGWQPRLDQHVEQAVATINAWVSSKLAGFKTPDKDDVYAAKRQECLNYYSDTPAPPWTYAAAEAALSQETVAVVMARVRDAVQLYDLTAAPVEAQAQVWKRALAQASTLAEIEAVLTSLSSSPSPRR